MTLEEVGRAFGVTRERIQVTEGIGSRAATPSTGVSGWIWAWSSGWRCSPSRWAR
jgi:hypothetical protein